MAISRSSTKPSSTLIKSFGRGTFRRIPKLLIVMRVRDYLLLKRLLPEAWYNTDPVPVGAASITKKSAWTF